jgi:catechol 2,3-dioxygenase-like lactoylglutathione lyase family enzyme
MAAFDHGSAEIGHPVRLVQDQIRGSQPAFAAEGHVVIATEDGGLAFIGVPHRFEDPAGIPALRGQHVQETQTGMVDGLRWFDEFLGPGERFVVLDPKTEERV